MTPVKGLDLKVLLSQTLKSLPVEPCKELLADFVKCQVLYKSANHRSIPLNKQRMTNINTEQAEKE